MHRVLPIPDYFHCSYLVTLPWNSIPSLKFLADFEQIYPSPPESACFFISILKSLSKIFVICTLYSVTYWNIVVISLCSSTFASSLCTDPSVLNLGISPLEFVHDEPSLLCVVQTSPNTFMHVIGLGFEGIIPSLFCGDGTNCWWISVKILYLLFY
jgi:hypothetical protein